MEVVMHDVAFGVGQCLRDRWQEHLRRRDPRCTLSVAEGDVIALVSAAADSIPIILTFLAASSIGFPECSKFCGRDDDGRRVQGNGLCQDRGFGRLRPDSGLRAEARQR